MSEPKRYNLGGRSLRWGPVNWSVASIRANWLQDVAFTVQLEPGDATRYDLLIVPARTPYVTIVGVPDMDTHLLVSYHLNGDGNLHCIRVGESHIDKFEELAKRPWADQANNWTAYLLCWWFQGLWQVLKTGQEPESITVKGDWDVL